MPGEGGTRPQERPLPEPARRPYEKPRVTIIELDPVVKSKELLAGGYLSSTGCVPCH
jgi:hypothetical protein